MRGITLRFPTWQISRRLLDSKLSSIAFIRFSNSNCPHYQELRGDDALQTEFRKYVTWFIQFIFEHNGHRFMRTYGMWPTPAQLTMIELYGDPRTNDTGQSLVMRNSECCVLVPARNIYKLEKRIIQQAAMTKVMDSGEGIEGFLGAVGSI